MASAALARDADSLANNNDGVLPSDVLYEVLLRVPAKSLCRLRLVCRSWRSLTSNPRFARAHSARHPLFVVHDDGDQEEPEIHIIDMYSGSIVKRISCDDLVKGVYGGIGEYLCKIMSTEASLVCISTSDGINELNIVLNPATGAVKILPDGNTLGLGKSCIIGYVPSTREYKVLHLCNYVTPEETFKVACEVITLGGYGDDDKRWRAKPSPVDISPNFQYIAVVHGVAYFWSSNDEDDDDNDDTMPSVALFDLATEKWRPSILPGPISCHLCHQDLDQIQFNSFDGCLVISHHKVRDCSTDLWFLMGVDNNRPSWTKRYSMRCEPCWEHTSYYPPRPLVILDDGRVVAWLEWQYILTVYDPSTGTWEDLTKLKYYFTIKMYQGSLLCSDLQGCLLRQTPNRSAIDR